MPRASLCTGTCEAVRNRGGVEPLLSWEYVHGNQEGYMISSGVQVNLGYNCELFI